MDTEKRNTLEQAISMLPILVYLHRKGIMNFSMNYLTGGIEVQLTADMFRECFPDAKPGSNGIACVSYNGTVFVGCTGEPS